MDPSFIILLVIGLAAAGLVYYYLREQSRMESGEQDTEIESPPQPEDVSRQPEPEVDQVDTLAEATAFINASRDANELLSRVMDTVIQLTGAQRGFIVLKNQQTGGMEAHVARGIDQAELGQDEFSRTVVNEVTASGQPLLTNNAQSDTRYSAGESIIARGLRAILAVPVKANDEVIGVVYLDTSMRTGMFKQYDLDLLNAVAQQAGNAIGKAELPQADLRNEPNLEEAGDYQEDTKELKPPAKPGPVPAQQQPRPGRMRERPQDILVGETKEEEASVEPPSPPETSAFPSVAAPSSGAASNAQAVQFSAYYPKEVKPATWESLHCYVFRQNAAMLVAADAQEQLGKQAPAYRQVQKSAQKPIQQGALITATPLLEGFQFNPPSVTLGFYEDWQRFDFKLRAAQEWLNQASNGFMTFSVEGVIVADLPISIYVGERVTASEIASAMCKLYQCVFASYSRQDKQIVERVERAYRALGIEYLRDVMSLRSGEQWSEGLLKLIDQADIFQLFWSQASATSDHVRFEWEYALKLDRDQGRFIRPVYWEQPMPPAPDALRHIHFAYQPELDDI